VFWDVFLLVVSLSYLVDKAIRHFESKREFTDFESISDLRDINGIAVGFTNDEEKIKFIIAEPNLIKLILNFDKYKVVPADNTAYPVFIYFKTPQKKIFIGKVVNDKYLVFNNNWNNAYPLSDDAAMLIKILEKPTINGSKNGNLN
jgi:hypothetical protein